MLGAKQDENETPKEHWQKLIAFQRNCDKKDIKRDDPHIPQAITTFTDKQHLLNPREDNKPQNSNGTNRSHSAVMTEDKSDWP